MVFFDVLLEKSALEVLAEVIPYLLYYWPAIVLDFLRPGDDSVVEVAGGAE